MTENNQPTLRVIPLGGLGEFGKNMMVVECGRDLVIIDAGQMFPEEEMLGIDMVLPDFTYIKKHADKVRAVILTHAHEDHIGALPYLLKEISTPVYGTNLTLGILKPKLEEYKIKKSDLREIKPERSIELGCLKVNFVRVSHSVPDGVGLVIETPQGIIVHSGDFKFDQTPVDGQITEFEKLAAYRGRTLALMSDSTNAESSGFTLPERSVGEKLNELIEQAPRRVIVASFASHIHRIQQVIDAAAANHRQVAIMGRSMIKNTEIAEELGFLNIPPGMLIENYEINKVKPEKLLILCTGSQGEPLSALTRMAVKSHRYVEIVEGDTVIISAKTVPGNEKSVNHVIDLLFKHGANVFYKSVSEVHVSGHAAQEELKMLINLIKPKYFIPIHGEYRHLKYHAQLARQVGVAEDNIIVAGNGDMIMFKNGRAKVKRNKVSAGLIFVDGLGVGDIGDVVLRDRKVLANDGICIVVVTVNGQTGQLLSGPDIVSRGFIYVKESKQLIEDAKKVVTKILDDDAHRNITDWQILRNDTRGVLSRFFWDRTKRRPMIMPIVVEL